MGVLESSRLLVGRLIGSFEHRREQSDELIGLGEEGVMAVVGGHLAVVAAGAGGFDHGGEGADVFGREEPVGGDADEGEVGLDAGVGGIGGLVGSNGVEDVHGAGMEM